MVDPGSSIFSSNILGDRGPVSPSVTYWRSLYYFNLYRLALAIFFLTVGLGGAEVGSFGSESPRVFLAGALAYGLLGLLNLVTITQGKPAFRLQARFQVLGDIVLIAVLLHASGGIDSGLGLLFIVSVAGGGVLLGGRMAIFFAAVATVVVLVEHLVTVMLGGVREGLMQIGVLGVGLFVTAFLIHELTKRISQTEAVAERRGIDLANLSQLNELVIQRIQLGVVVLDADGKVRMMNDTARRLLGADPPRPQRPSLKEIASELHEHLARWAGDPGKRFRAAGAHGTLLARFIRLGEEDTSGTLIFLEDADLVDQQAQQVKLAALGRLTAGIAHEIRNPLGAISHAQQLLAESGAFGAEDRRLLTIIQDQCRRINQLIEDVMQLGRRDHAARQDLALRPWLVQFARLFTETQELPGRALRLEGPPVTVNVDPDQLHQILFNLCQNALRHSPAFSGKALVTLRTGRVSPDGRPTLEVIDRGSGVAPEIADQIFEPFFTTRTDGTGLGLYIARELCEANRGRLDFRPAPGGGACFRITFARPEAEQVSRRRAVAGARR